MNFHRIKRIDNGIKKKVTLKDGYFFHGGKSVQEFDSDKDFNDAMANINEGKDNMPEETKKAMAEGLKPKKRTKKK